MEPVRLRLGELLVDARIITKEQLDEVLAMQKRDGRRLGTLLVEREFINETQLTQILSQQLSVPWVSLYHVDFSKRLLSMVPVDVARKYSIVPIYVRHVRGQGDTLYVAMDDPTNLDALRECASWAGLPTRAMIASPADIRRAIDVYYGPDPDAVEAETAEATPPEPEPQSAAKAEVDEAPATTDADASEAPAPEPEANVDATTGSGGSEPPPSARSLGGGTLDATAPAHDPSGEVHEVAVDADAAPVVDAGEALPEGDDGEVSVEVGEELSLDEILARRKPAPSDGEARPPLQRSKSGKMLSLTLLDGTTLALPVSRKGKPRKSSLVGSMHDEPGPAEVTGGATSGPAAYSPQASREVDESSRASMHEVNATDLLARLRAAVRGAAMTEATEPGAEWQTLFAALLTVLVRKGLVSEEELLEELKKS